MDQALPRRGGVNNRIMQDPKKTCIIIAGPTAVGKTRLAVDLALHYNTSIVSADSRQCFRELNIGVAKPDEADLARVRHYFINSHSIFDEMSAAIFEEYALAAIDEIFQTRDVAVMVGGTGLYIQAFCEGMDLMPAVDPSVRKSIADDYRQYGLGWLQKTVQKEDPDWFASGEVQNPQRMMRALELVRQTGKSILSYQQSKTSQRPFHIVKIGLNLPRPQLYSQINHRTDLMIEQGLEEEARSLLPHRGLNALQTVGYRELFEYFDGAIDKDRAIELIKRNTRHYAKRQLTWFLRDEAFSWASPLDQHQIITLLSSLV